VGVLRKALPWLLALLLCGAATAQPAAPLTTQGREALLALDPERIGEREVRELRALAPAPRVLLFKGSVGADMESFGAFLKHMGYPQQQLLNPATGRYSYSFAWSGCRCTECEAMPARVGQWLNSEGMAPMLVGHSGGGVTVGRILQELATADGTVPRLPFAATLGTGALLRWAPGFPGCAADVPRLGLVPPSVQAFTGYRIAGDPFTALLGFGDYRAVESGAAPAQVRNVLLAVRVARHTAGGWDNPALADDLRDIAALLNLAEVPALKLLQAIDA